MSQVIQCDRCGKVYDHRLNYLLTYEGILFKTFSWVKPEAIKIDRKGLLSGLGSLAKTLEYKSYDLCPDCRSKFIDWIKNKEPEDDEE